MPAIDLGEGKPSPSQIDAARRILAHPAKRTYGKGSVGTTVRAIKVYLKWKGFDPGPLNGHWDTQAQKAFSKARGGDSRATPATLREISKDFGKPGPRPRRISPTLASMRPIMPGAMDQGGDALRDALSGVPPASGVGPQPGMMNTEEAGAVARTADRHIGDLTGDAGGTPVPFGPGHGATDPFAQGYGEQDVAPAPSNSDYIPPLPPGGAIPTAPGGPGASADVSAPMTPEGDAAMAPDPNAPSPDQGGPPFSSFPFGPGHSAGDPLQQQLTPPPNWPPDPNAPPPADMSQTQSPMGAPPPPPPQAAPTPPPADQGGLTAADLVPPNDTGGSPIPQALGSVPDSTQTGDLGALPGAPPVPPPGPPQSGDLGALAPTPPTPTPPPLPPTDEDTAVAGDLGTLDPAVRSPDTEVPGWMPAATKVAGEEGHIAGGIPGDLSGYATPPDPNAPSPRLRPEHGDVGDLTGSTPPSGGGSTRTIKKGDTLWDIAEQEYGDPRLWPMIAKANPGIRDPNKIYYGKKLNIPAL